VIDCRVGNGLGGWNCPILGISRVVVFVKLIQEIDVLRHARFVRKSVLKCAFSFYARDDVSFELTFCRPAPQSARRTTQGRLSIPRCRGRGSAASMRRLAPGPVWSGWIEARIELRMMPTFPRSPLSFRTVSCPQYGCRVDEDVAILIPHSPGCANFPLPVLHAISASTMSLAANRLNMESHTSRRWFCSEAEARAAGCRRSRL
jgi:hypothetical protein